MYKAARFIRHLPFANIHQRRNRQTTIRKGIAQDGLRLCPRHRPVGFGFQLGNLPTHLRNLPLHSFLGHQERMRQVPAQREKVRNRLK
jgi:hypothetical protein